MTGETVLVVEDDSALLLGVCDTLELAGYHVLAAAGGEAAVSMLGDARPDIVISDIMMPGMDGFELFRIVRAHPKHMTVPFVFLTARSERADVRAGMRVGADDYITKPFDEAELLEAVTSRLRRRDELEAARRRAYTKLAGQMVSTLNHELRAPLAQLSAFAELLEEGGTDLAPAEFDSLIRGMHGGVSRLLRVVTDVAMLADLRSGRASATFERRCKVIDDVPMLLHNVASQYSEQANESHHPIRLDVPQSLPPIVGDIVYLRDALGRLLDNAIKFSHREGEPIGLQAHADAARLFIAVTDEGVGISPRTIAAIFEPLRQIDRETREQQGLGTGLAIARSLVELHGGTIEVASEVGRGSAFTVVVPCANAPGQYTPDDGSKAK